MKSIIVFVILGVNYYDEPHTPCEDLAIVEDYDNERCEDVLLEVQELLAWKGKK